MAAAMVQDMTTYEDGSHCLKCGVITFVVLVILYILMALFGG